MSTNNSINNGTVITTVYNTPGSTTWTKNSRTRIVNVAMWSGGGGGGSGSMSFISGQGGTGGCFTTATFPALFFNATETVVVGSGGTGGAQQSTPSVNGNNGANGGVSSFANIYASGGLGGLGGLVAGSPYSTTAPLYNYLCLTAPCSQFPNVSSAGPYGSFGSGNGGYPAGADNSRLGRGNYVISPDVLYPTGSTITTWLIPGGGGAGADESGGDGATGSDGGSIYASENTILVAGGVGVSGGNGGNGNDGYVASGGLWAGSGGAGGGLDFVTVFHGGNGGYPAGGGGAGPGGDNDTPIAAGAGGNGAKGAVIVTEYL